MSDWYLILFLLFISIVFLNVPKPVQAPSEQVCSCQKKLSVHNYSQEDL